jgi:hypothetical protein
MSFLGGTIGGVELPPRFPRSMDSHAETSKLVRALTNADNQFVVAHTGYPVFDIATSCYKWFNAEVGDSEPTIGSGAFVKVMIDMGLARVVDDELQ